MNPMQQVPASQQVQQLTQQLTQALLQQEESQAKLDEAKKAIVAIRNVLAGLSLGQQLQKEIDAEKAKVALVEPK